MTTTTTKLEQSYAILDSLRMKNHLYLASSSADYSFIWLRDSFYEVLPYLYRAGDHYEKTYHAILDILNNYSWKFNAHTMRKPQYPFEYIHPRYTADGKEVFEEWGNCQHDAIGAILYGVAKGEKAGKNILRNEKDLDTIQNIIWYLDTCRYWEDPDNGMWEEGREIHLSSLGACVAGLSEIKDIVLVPNALIEKGLDAIANLFPNESESKAFDLAQLSLIYPYNVLNDNNARHIVDQIEKQLLRRSGVIRYKGDSYYASDRSDDRTKGLGYYFGKEAEWTFGLPWLALCHMQFGDYEKAKMYLDWTEEKMLEDGRLPELYFAGSDDYNKNCPLGWSNAMYILAKEAYDGTDED